MIERSPLHRHPHGHVGVLDESARRLSHEELAVARLLVGEGHHVKSLAARDHATADLSVCRRDTEVKTLLPGATSRTVVNGLRRAVSQGQDVIVDARHSGLLRLAAERGVSDFAARFDRGRIERIRVLGAGFDRLYQAHDLERIARRRGRGFEPGVA